MNKKEIKDMIEPIPNWEFTYRYDCSRTCGKSYTQSLLDEKDKKIKDLQKKVEQLEKENKELNNIINELEKILSSEMYKDIAVAKCLDKLKELKENNK